MISKGIKLFEISCLYRILWVKVVNNQGRI